MNTMVGEVSIITVGDTVYAVANKQAAQLKFDAEDIGRGEVLMWTVRGEVWARFRLKLAAFDDLQVVEYMDPSCACLATCREECTCYYW